ncbi:MAG: hypothetical protein ACUVXA_02890 [Candidatus Jordarchaeum sp.]|uniref:hypothetical protein n=1 Tax=Candidatus Jordarchaeum sp. TaxID=2823881 RepID=UPI0040499776
MSKVFDEAISRGDFIEAYRIAKFVLRDDRKKWDIYINALDSIGNLIHIAVDLKSKGNFEEAIKLFLRCAEFFEGERDYGRASGFFIEVGDCFSATNNQKKALDSFIRGYELAILDWRTFDPAKKTASLSILLSILVTLFSAEISEAKNIFKLTRSSLEEKERLKLRRQDYYRIAKYVYNSLIKGNTLNLKDLKKMRAKQEKTDFLTLMQDLSKAFITVERFLEKFLK